MGRGMSSKRPIRKRIWFYKPAWPRDGEGFSLKHDFQPFSLGDDEYHWRTLVIGTNLTGQIVIALHEFKCDDCDEGCPPKDYPGWPVTIYDYEETFVGLDDEGVS